MPLERTLSRFPPAAAAFARSLLDHHWREASWAYTRRGVMHEQGALLDADAWSGVEARADAHVEALCRGGALVVEDCDERIGGNRVGELAVGLRIVARMDWARRFNEWVEQLDWSRPRHAQAVVDALAWDAPDSWRELVGAILDDESAPEQALGPLARVAGMRGWPVGDSLVGVLEDRVGDLEAIAWATGALRTADAVPELEALIQEPEDGAVRRAAAIAALRFEPEAVVRYLSHVVAAEEWAAVPLALAAGTEQWTRLRDGVLAEPTPDRAIALGLFGAQHAIEPLLDLLGDEQCGAAAAEALFLLTGAPLREEAHARDPKAEPGNDDERRPALLVARLSRERQVWSEWIADWGGRPRPAGTTRVRHGVAIEPTRVLQAVARTDDRAEIRGWMLEELDIRYGAHVPAWPGLLQCQQQRARAMFPITSGSAGDWARRR
ncbi:MAG: hypothetical protein AAF799_00985 [Myxococcota bacterium]